MATGLRGGVDHSRRDREGSKDLAPMRARVLASTDRPFRCRNGTSERCRADSPRAGVRNIWRWRPLRGRCRALGIAQRIGAAIGGDDGSQIGDLLRGERHQLIAGLRRLKRAGGVLAGADQHRHLRGVRAEIGDDGRLVFIASWRPESVFASGPEALATSWALVPDIDAANTGSGRPC